MAESTELELPARLQELESLAAELRRDNNREPLESVKQTLDGIEQQISEIRKQLGSIKDFKDNRAA